QAVVGLLQMDRVAKLAIYNTTSCRTSKSGSKPNETTRSYENLAEKLTEISNVHFVWITDGEGWQRSKSNLEEAFERIPRLYNLHDIRNKNIKELLEMEMD
ncbi:DpnII family type II restriction endonuclease, partial [Streptococcus suis]